MFHVKGFLKLRFHIKVSYQVSTFSIPYKGFKTLRFHVTILKTKNKCSLSKHFFILRFSNLGL
jgi:hypothetical protein